MKATETTLQELLGGSKQYQVPLYQRTYSWSERQFTQLWNDIVELAEDVGAGRADATHFIGSMVLAPSPAIGPAGVQEWLVVDGQQRLTTLTVLLAALRDHSVIEDAQAVDRINDLYLTNRWAQDHGRYKLLPTQHDRPEYEAIVERTPTAGGGDGIGAAYRFFRRELEQVDDPEDRHDIARIEQVITQRLALVVIAAQPGDNVHRIFESLNNTGVRLTQADLLRNYFFMRMPTRGHHAYQTLWLPLHQALGAEQLELLVWLDLVLRGDDRVRRDEIYRAQQARLDKVADEAGLESELSHLAQRGEFLLAILNPDQEADPAVSAALRRLADWGAQTVYPLAMHLLERRHLGSATSGEVAHALLYVESYLVRRMIMGKGTTGTNRVLQSIVAEMRTDLPVDEAVRHYLSGRRKWFPSDSQLTQAIVNDPFYWRGRGPQRSFVLRRIEQSYGNKEPVVLEGLTIEHVLPQQPTDDWWHELAADGLDADALRALHARVVHTLGNLTLTGYNATLSNRPFAKKRELLVSSGLRMNQEIAARATWREQEIRQRGEVLAARCIQIWPGPTEEDPDLTDSTGLALRQLLAALPPASWTTYGDVAEVLGSHAVAVGTRITSTVIPNAHRVLQASGKLSPGFHWIDPDRNDDPIELLTAEGIVFLPDGSAHPAQRMTAEDLADLLGIERDEAPAEDLAERSDLFEQQLTETVPSARMVVRTFLDRWRQAGGTVDFNTSATVSATLRLRPFGHDSYVLLCATIYPTTCLEIGFQYLKSKAPFDQVALRDEFRQRLNKAPGVEIPEAKLGLRPSIKLELLAAEDVLDELVAAFEWLVDTARSQLLAYLPSGTTMTS